MLSAKQQEVVRFAASQKSSILSVGAIRSGKTFSSVVGFGLYMISIKEANTFAIVGKRARVIDTEIIPQLRAQCSALGASFSYNHTTQQGRAGHQHFVVCANVNERSADALQGMTIHSLLADEATLMDKRFFETAMSRLSKEHSKAWITCNPASPKHWLKKEWVDQGLIDDVLGMNFESNPSLSESVVKRYERTFSGVFAERMIKGLWAATEGLVYPVWSYEDPEASGWTTVARSAGVDYGPASTTAIVFLDTLRKNKETRYLVSRSYSLDGRKRNRSDEEIINWLLDLPEIPQTRSLVLDPRAVSLRKGLRNRNTDMRIRIGDGRSVLEGVREVDNLLRRGIICLSKRASGLAEELEGYEWDPRKEDTPLKRDDHHADALRYVVGRLSLATSFQMPIGA